MGRGRSAFRAAVLAVLVLTGLAAPPASAAGDPRVDVALRIVQGAVADNPNAVAIEVTLTRHRTAAPPARPYVVRVTPTDRSGRGGEPYVCPAAPPGAQDAHSCGYVVDGPGAWTFTATALRPGTRPRVAGSGTVTAEVRDASSSARRACGAGSPCRTRGCTTAC